MIFFFFFFSSRRRHTRSVSAFLLNRSSDLLSNRYKLITNVRSSLMAVNIHITIIELNALHTKRQNLFQELDAVIHLLMEAKHWGLRKSRNATSLNSRFKSLDTLKVKMRQAHADGWFIVFDTLTLADDRLEAFYDNPNALRDYFRDIGRMVLAAE